MAALKFDGTINIPTIGSFISTIIAAVIFIMSIKGDVKVHASDIATLKQEVGELRRIQMRVSSRQDSQEAAVQETTQKVASVAKVVATNKAQLNKNTQVIKAIPELVTAVVEAQPKVMASPPPPEPSPLPHK